MGQFAQETRVVKVAENQWQGELHAGWRIGTVPNGGYVLSIAGRVLSEALPHKDPLAVNAFYLAPTQLGPIHCELEILREGGSTSHACVKMYQQDELKVQVTAAYTDLDRLQGPSWSAAKRPLYAPWEECMAGGSSKIEFRERVDLRLALGGEVFASREPSGRAEFGGWIRHKDGSDPDLISLLMFADAFPPPAFDIVGLVGWVPTIELTVQLRAKPAPGLLQVRLLSRHLDRGVVEADGEYWDSEGKLVAISRQTAKVRLPRD
ncbi:thioesterase family protein [Parahaliea sp. F7430]|uniref:Thioesterase family protein n=1 Tax=Sediminihaliea albiluteola TaxID=2758564 RepID=A0A7W2YI44_9GAMM|nr:thioesterase family protein [Sediminihaliea albiluteola]MBA6411652.1 thioesterase family protein [Sediminihaliea albiluteola]